MTDTVFTTSNPLVDTNAPVNLNNVVAVHKSDAPKEASIVFILNVHNSVIWSYYNREYRDADFDRLLTITNCCGTGGGGLGELEELVETFENLISGTVVTITDYQPGDIVLVHRNGLFKRPDGVDYTRSGATITFVLPFGSSTGSLGDGETVTVLTLRQL